MDLILWRHAEAEMPLDGMDDLSRSLTPKGERQASRMVAKLLKMDEESCPVRKGAVWWLRTRVRQGQPQTVLLTVACPELISRSWDVPS